MAARPPPLKLTEPTPREHPLQVQIARVLTMELAPAGKVSRKGVVWWSVDHANFAGMVPGVRLSRGVIAGIPDMFFIYRGLSHLIEIKAADGVLSEPQKAVLAACIAAQARVGICRDAFEVIDCLDQWEIPRARLVRMEGS